MSFLSKPYQIFLDGAVYTPGYGKDVVYGFNAVKNIYLATCLSMISTSELDKIDSNLMCVDAIRDGTMWDQTYGCAK